MRKKKRTQKPTDCSSGEEDNGSEHSCDQKSIWQKIHGITLSQKDRDIILDGHWLNDSIIHAAQLLMKHDQDLLPIGSLQNSLLGQTLEFDVASDECVQIIHSGGNHWITISTVGTKHPTVKIYDSLYNTLPWVTKEQIATLLHTEESAITLEYANVQVKSILCMYCNWFQLLLMPYVYVYFPQKQRNGSDCGVFALPLPWLFVGVSFSDSQDASPPL